MTEHSPAGPDQHEIIRHLVNSPLWASSWYGCSNFLVRFYVTICFATTNLALSLDGPYLLISTIALLHYDRVWGRFRIPVQNDARAFVEAILHTNSFPTAATYPVNHLCAIHLWGIVCGQVLWIGAGQLGGVFAMGVLIAVGITVSFVEYIMWRRDRWILKNLVLTITGRLRGTADTPRNRMDYVKKGPLQDGASLTKNKVAAVSSMFLMHSFFLLFIHVFDRTGFRLESAEWGEIGLLMSAFGVDFLCLYLIFQSALVTRAMDVAKRYLEVERALGATS